jgi:hypothetical protein
MRVNSFDIDLPEATEQRKKENISFFSHRIIWVKPHLPACEYKRARTCQTESKKTEREVRRGAIVVVSSEEEEEEKEGGSVLNTYIRRHKKTPDLFFFVSLLGIMIYN